MFWKNLIIKRKLFLIFMLIISLFSAGFYSIFLQFTTVNKEIDMLKKRNNTSQIVTELTTLINETFITAVGFDIRGQFDSHRHEETRERIEEVLAHIEQEVHLQQNQDLFKSIGEDYLLYDQMLLALLAERAPNSDEERINRIRTITSLNTIRNRILMHNQQLTLKLVNQVNDAGDNVQKSVLKTKLILVASLLVSVLIGTIIFILFSNSITRRINEAVTIARNVSNGNLVNSSGLVQSKDELGQLNISMGQMITSLRSLVKKIAVTSEHAAASSEQLTAISKETGHALGQISASIQQIAVGAEEQLGSTIKTKDVVEKTENRIIKIEKDFQAVFQSSNETVQTAINGNGVVEKSIGHMRVISEKTNAVAVFIAKLEEKSDEIDQILLLITKLSEQTNLLALNAAIEAAKAGEQGRGFAVVADGVRTLAERSRTAVTQISFLIQNIKEYIKKSALAMEEGSEAIEQGINLVDEAGVTFANITNEVTNALEQTEHMTKSIGAIQFGIQEMSNSVDETKLLANRFAKHTQLVGISVEGQNNATQEIIIAAQQLAEIAQQLQNDILKFKI